MKRNKIDCPSLVILLTWCVCASPLFAAYNGQLINAQYQNNVHAGAEDLVINVTAINNGTDTWPGGWYASWYLELVWPILGVDSEWAFCFGERKRAQNISGL